MSQFVYRLGFAASRRESRETAWRRWLLAEVEAATVSPLMAFAAKRFAEQGYHPTSVSEIVTGLGVGKGVFYWYFDSKDALFHALMDDQERALRDHIAKLLSSGAGTGGNNSARAVEWTDSPVAVSRLVEETPVVPDDWAAATVPLSSVVRRGGAEPTRLVLFRRPIEHRCDGRADLEAMVLTIVVEQVAELLGIDPLHVANEGKALIGVRASDADAVLARRPLTRDVDADDRVHGARPLRPRRHAAARGCGAAR